MDDPVGKMVEQVELDEVDYLHCSKRPKCHHHHQEPEFQSDGMYDEQV